MVRSLITKGDYSVMRRANNWVAPRWVRAVRHQLHARSATDGCGTPWASRSCCLAANRAFKLWAPRESRPRLSVLLFAWLKRLTGRRRPCQIEPHCWATLLPPDQFSFPSGHTMTAFAVAIPLALFYPTLAIGLFFCALSIAMSRILLGMHFLSDVVAGALIGTGLGYLGYFAFV